VIPYESFKRYALRTVSKCSQNSPNTKLNKINDFVDADTQKGKHSKDDTSMPDVSTGPF
jgi:hypothetical protein